MMPGAPMAWAGEPTGERRTIPFDHSFVFQVTRAQLGTTLQRKLDVSVEAAFVAVSMGYAVVPVVPREEFGIEGAEDLDVQATSPKSVSPTMTAMFAAMPRPRMGLADPRPDLSVAGHELSAGVAARAAAVPDVGSGRLKLDALSSEEREVARRALQALPPRAITLGDMIRALSRRLGEAAFADRGDIGPRTAAALRAGFRLRPDAAAKLLDDGGSHPDPALLARLFEVVDRPSEPIRFLYALHDQATGRSFQSEPVLNLAGLGEDLGKRPFRTFTPPIRFEKLSSIRLDIVPRSEFEGELHVVLHGFKVLGGVGTPTGRALLRRRRRRFAR